jgi:hypothetical protein
MTEYKNVYGDPEMDNYDRPKSNYIPPVAASSPAAPSVTISAPSTGTLPGTSAVVRSNILSAAGVDSAWFTVEYCPLGPGCQGEGLSVPAGHVAMSLVSGDVTAGTWEGTWTFANCAYANEKWTVRCYAQDVLAQVNPVVPFVDDLVLGGRGC